MVKIDKKIYLRRFVALPLVFLLAFVPAVPVAHASDPVTAATLAVTGGQLAAGGLAGEAGVAALAGPVGAVVGLTLAACGVSAYVSSAAQAAGKSRSRFVADKLVIWGAQAGYTAEQLYQRIADGISVAVDGTIQLSNDAAKIIQQFGNWLFTQDGEVVPSISSGSSSSVTAGDLDFLVVPFSVPCSVYFNGTWYDDTYNLTSTSTLPVAIAAYIYNSYYGRTTYRFVGFAPKSQLSSGSIDLSARSSVTLRLDSTSTNGAYIYGSAAVGYVSNIPGTIPVFESYSAFVTWVNHASGWDITDNPVSDEVFTGTPEAWTQNKDVLNPSAEDTPITLNPDLLNPIIDALAQGTQATMSIKDYIEALQAAFDQALDDVKSGVAQLTDTVTGIQDSIAIPDTAASNPSITNPSVEPSTVPVLDPSAVNPDAVITGFQFDLSQIFPFCLPFDVYRMLQLLDAEPVAPAYRFQFDIPIPGVLGHSSSSWRFDYTMDLSQFNAVAALLRKLELLSFCIGLAYVTRSMFIRS